MMLRQGWALATSPHGASQTIFSPDISGVPEARAIAARSGVSANTGAATAKMHSATKRRRFIGLTSSDGNPLTGWHRSQAHSTLRRDRAAPVQASPRSRSRAQRWRGIVDRVTVLAAVL